MEKNLLEPMIKQILDTYHIELLDQFLLKKSIDGKAPDTIGHTWRLTPDSLEFYDNNTWHPSDYALCDLLRGYCTIEPIPFVPKNKQRYYYVAWNSGNQLYVTEDEWEGGSFDLYNLAFGNAFRTPQAAEKNKDKIFQDVMKKASQL